MIRLPGKALGAETFRTARYCRERGPRRPDLQRTVCARAGWSVLAYMAAMQSSLVEIVGRVRSATDDLATGVQQIAAGGLDLSQRTEEQVSALEETAATMEELNGAARKSAEGAQAANQLAGNASVVAERGGAQVAQVVLDDAGHQCELTPHRRDHQCDRWHRIPDQHSGPQCGGGSRTRWRAGSRVCSGSESNRHLAQRSAEAAKEIKQLIHDSVLQVSSGTSLVTEAGATIRDVVDVVQRVGQMVEEDAAMPAPSRSARLLNQVNPSPSWITRPSKTQLWWKRVQRPLRTCSFRPESWWKPFPSSSWMYRLNVSRPLPA